MVEEIKKELKENTVIVDDYYDYETEVICKEILFKILDKYKNQPKEIIHIGSRIGKSLQQAQNIAKYINDNKLTECNINVVEVPKNYKNAWEELKQEKLVKNYLLEYMQELEQKYNLDNKQVSIVERVDE